MRYTVRGVAGDWSYLIEYVVNRWEWHIFRNGIEEYLDENRIQPTLQLAKAAIIGKTGRYPDGDWTMPEREMPAGAE